MKKIVLASSSPRRKELLYKYDIEPLIIPSDVSERILSYETYEQVAMSLAFLKASSVAKKLDKNEIVIGADTLVCLGDNILGKPHSKEDAAHMLTMMSGEEHFVVTGIAIIEANTNNKVIDYEKTIVKFRELTNDKIERYLETGEYKDKAGGYAIQGCGEVLVDEIRGCYSNVVGLPITKLDKLLEKYFNISLL